MKKCFKCGIEKALDCFGSHASSSDRLQVWCKDCMKEYHRSWRPKYSKNIERKLCYQCKLVLPAESFSKNSRATDGLQTMCKHCTKVYHSNPEVRRKNNENQCAKWRSGEARNARYQKLFGLTLSEYDKMFSEQNGVCKICSRPQDGRTKNLDVDHDHKSGAVRSLLCSNCNRALGLFQDSLLIVKKAAAYLAVYENQNETVEECPRSSQPGELHG